MTDLLTQPMPWYVSGPLIGLMLPLLWVIGNKTFGVSSSFRHACASVMPKNISYFNYDWKAKGAWNLKFVGGILVGGIIAGLAQPKNYIVDITTGTRTALANLGIDNFSTLIPQEVFNSQNLLSFEGFVIMVVGGFLVGFGARYAGGCTSGHAITGMATLQRASLIAVLGFFAGGLITTYFLLPLILS